MNFIANNYTKSALCKFYMCKHVKKTSSLWNLNPSSSTSAKVCNVCLAMPNWVKLKTPLTRDCTVLELVTLSRAMLIMHRTRAACWTPLDLCDSENPECFFNFKDLKILDTASHDLLLKYMESILLKYEKQKLNTQEKSMCIIYTV